MRYNLLLVFALLFGLAACSSAEPTLDTSSQEAMRKSLLAMTDRLPEGDRAKLSPAILRLAMAGIAESESPLVALAAIASDKEFMITQLAPYQGKSGAELIALADALEDVGSPTDVAEAKAPSCYKGSPSVLTVSDWSIVPIDPDANEVTVVLKNHDAKAIRMVEGQIAFVDALGDTIGPMAIDRDLVVAPNAEYTQDGRWGQYTFERLLTLKKEEVTALACVSAVLYDDGSKGAF